MTIREKYEAAAAKGIRKVMIDGEMVEMESLDVLRRAAEAEDKAAAAASNRGRLGIKMFRVRTGGAAPQ